jgi:hypothetical protein
VSEVNDRKLLSPDLENAGRIYSADRKPTRQVVYCKDIGATVKEKSAHICYSRDDNGSMRPCIALKRRRGDGQMDVPARYQSRGPPVKWGYELKGEIFEQKILGESGVDQHFNGMGVAQDVEMQECIFRQSIAVFCMRQSALDIADPLSFEIHAKIIRFPILLQHPCFPRVKLPDKKNHAAGGGEEAPPRSPAAEDEKEVEGNCVSTWFPRVSRSQPTIQMASFSIMAATFPDVEPKRPFCTSSALLPITMVPNSSIRACLNI